MWFGVCKSGYGIRWGGFDRAKLDMLILIRIPFSFHACNGGGRCEFFAAWYDQPPSFHSTLQHTAAEEHAHKVWTEYKVCTLIGLATGGMPMG